MNIPIFLHVSNDPADFALPMFRPETSTRRHGDRQPAFGTAAENSSAAHSAKTDFAADPPCRPDASCVPTAASAAEQGAIYRFDQADYAALARRYANLLRRALLENAMPTEQAAFCRRMLDDLEGALAQCGSSRPRGRTPDHRFEAELELQWLCNQCRHCFGDAAAPALHWSGPQVDPRDSSASATDGELAAISCLFAVSRAVAGRSTDRAAWLRHGGGALSILGHRLREACARTAAWLRRQASAAKSFIRRAEQHREGN